ncbi:MAG: prephenate dehydrogenase [Clostridia bacterium]|nr:prephenate dehydrogenase [Clostridia bacterium]
MKIGIIGLGLMGGSLAKALKLKAGIEDITAFNNTPQALSQAKAEGIISRGCTELNEHIFNCDIIFICTPVKPALHYLSVLSGRINPDCIVTDICSTKEEIVRFADSLSAPVTFVGGHPMAGSEKTGYAASVSHMFENAYYVLTPGKTSSERALKQLSELAALIGSIPVVIEPGEHDLVTAGISHVPHIIASTLVNLVRQEDTPDGKMQMLAAGGFRDITRIASSSPEMWENIVISNKHQIKRILEKYVELINIFSHKIECGDSRWIYEAFESARAFRDSFSARKRGPISPTHEIAVDVIDKPGIIGKIATILGDNGINIKNINVSNSREFEQGCLRVTLPDSSSVDSAFGLLEQNGYKVYRL